jgi:hypothetical protein
VGETRERTVPRSLKAAVAGLVLAGLLAVVALAARSDHPGGGNARLHQREVPAQVGNDLLTILVIAYAVAIVVLLAGAYMLRGLSQMIMLVALTATVTFLATRVAHNGLGEALRRNAEQAQRQSGRTPRTPTLPNRPAANKPAQLDWVLAGIIGGGLVIAAVVFLVRRRERLESDEPEETVEEELSAVVSDTIDDLRREPDARRAVIAAYARMERVLAQHGRPRRRSEAPFEYLARVLLGLRVRAAAVRDLTELFERAKFSTHEIDEAMRERAIAALVSVREDLQAPAPVAAA